MQLHGKLQPQNPHPVFFAVANGAAIQVLERFVNPIQLNFDEAVHVPVDARCPGPVAVAEDIRGARAAQRRTRMLCTAES